MLLIYMMLGIQAITSSFLPYLSRGLDSIRRFFCCWWKQCTEDSESLEVSHVSEAADIGTFPFYRGSFTAICVRCQYT